ncbi:MAG: TonB-dependent receptor [Verrucomicrobia bacterium]|nr:TonB-dependent receptor [Verrucomicrobiota bacterium]
MPRTFSPLPPLRWLTLALLLVLPVLPGRAATPATGTVTGRVQNVVTGQYLNNAQVTLSGTTHTAYTDKFGVFQMVGVPAGPAVLEVFYTDLDRARIPIQVPAGGTVEQAVNLTSVARYGRDAETVKLDAFVVASDRETDSQAIATNEQRFAPNLKNVMATDTLGDILGGSVGEFLKFLPGVTVENDWADVAGISVRGIGGAMTSITADGAPASNIWATPTRSVDVRSMALNDIARIELTKVPTPATPADSLAGSVNMVGKSAFERTGRQLRYSLNLVGNHENLTLQRTPHSNRDHNTFKILPGANLDFTWPVTKTFGLVIAGTNASIYNEQHFTRTYWSATGSGTNAAAASLRNPIMYQYYLLDGPRNIVRNTLSVKADWKATPHSVFSLGHVASRTDTWIGSLSMTLNAGTNGTPTPATGLPMLFDARSTRGATGRGTMTNSGTNQLGNQITDTTNLTFRFDDGRWRIESGISRSASEMKRRYGDAGFFYTANATNRNPIRISFQDIDEDKPGRIDLFDNSGTPLDWREIANFRGTTATAVQTRNVNEVHNGYVNVRRGFNFLPFPTALQLGASRRDQKLDTNMTSEAWTFQGPDGRSGTTAPLDPYIMRVYRNVDSHYGFRNIQWMSPSRAWEAYLANPLLYGKTEAQRVTEANYAVDNYERLDESVQAGYVQAEAQLFNHRLRVLGGVRFERTLDDGQGALTDNDAVWQRNPDGSFVRNAAGQRVRKPEAGAVNSYAQFLLTRKPRAVFSHRTYEGYYPSLHLTYNVTENFLARFGYASTYGRPNFTDIIPRIVATGADLDDDDPDPPTGRGTLTVRNPALKPWTADNYDFSAEFYTAHGGLLSAGLFRKDIQNFFGDSARFATPELLATMGLDPRYVGWNVITKFNAGDARISGVEVNIRQSLRGLGRWGSYFTLFANGTKLDLDGQPGASFTSFIPKSGNWGATFSSRRVTLTARWNYRGLDRRLPQAAFGPDGYEYFKERITLDMNGSYQLSRRFSVVASANNVLNEPQTLLRYGSETPAYARQYQEAEFGIQMALGLRGTF